MKHILNVDDEAHIRDLIRQVLMGHGYRVTGVESAHEGLEVVRRDPPDLILSDLQLEDSDGFEFIDQVKQLAPQIPIVLLTGVLFDPAVVRRLGEDKIAAYIEKTAPLSRILSELSRILGKK